MSKIMRLPREIVLFYEDPLVCGRWYSKGLVDVDAYPELEPYCIEEPCATA